MAGETWQSQWQIGKETTPGTDAAASRIMYFEPDSALSEGLEIEPKKFATGTRDNVRAISVGPQLPGGSVIQQLSASEIIELLLLGIKGGITPTQPAAGPSPTVYLWTFVPGALDSATLEWHDGANQWQMLGTRVNQLELAGSVREAPMVTAELLGTALALATLTGSLSQRTPDFINPWEAKLYIDAFGGTPGSTNIANFLISYSLSINNNLGRKFWADNVDSAGAVIAGELEITGTFLIEAVASQADTEFAAWRAGTKRLLRLELGNNEIAEDALTKFVKIDLPGAWTAADLGQVDEQTRAYELSFQYVYDPTLAAGVKFQVQNNRSAAW